MTKRWSSRIDDKYFNPKKESKKYSLVELDEKNMTWLEYKHNILNPISDYIRNKYK